MKILDNLKKNTILLLLITVLVLYILLKDDFNEIVNAFQHIDFKYIVLAVIFFFLSVIIKGYVNYIIANNKEKLSLKEAIKHNFITQFFNGVTPFSTGGQPMEVYMLTEHGIPLTKATNQTIQSFIFYQIALVICGIIAVSYNFLFHVFPKVKLLKHLVFLGFLINVAVAVVLVLISSSHAMTKRIERIVKWVCKKLKIKINEKELSDKIEDFHNGFQELKTRKGLFLRGVSLNIISLLLLYTTPLLVLHSMTGDYAMSFVETITASAYVYIVGSFVPIPGASGGIEYSFTQFFGNFIGLDMISAVLIIWRTITYYFGILVGALLFNLEKKVKR